MINRDDATKTGYDLGAPKRRSSNPERVRDLSAPAVCIVRALMHSVFVWATCNNQQELEHIAEVTKRKVVPANLPEFFWIHLEKDMECMMQCTGRGIEECAIIVHLVLQQIFFKTPETCKWLCECIHVWCAIHMSRVCTQVHNTEITFIHQLGERKRATLSQHELCLCTYIMYVFIDQLVICL